MAGLVPATPITWHAPCLTIGVAGTSPAMTEVGSGVPINYANTSYRSEPG